MVIIDLITGFLGAGKTTFLKKYVSYLKNKGEKICILENDYGAINIDMMLVSNLGVDSEMVSGGCDLDCHKRRFKTKLISMAMRGYTRIIVEPSGIYDTDEFFDTIYEEPIDSMYEIGNVICIFDSTIKELSDESKYFVTTQIAVAGALIFSKCDLDSSNKDLALSIIKDSLKDNQCNRNIDNIVFDINDIDKYIDCGYSNFSYLKRNIIDDNNYDSLYFMNKSFNKNSIEQITNELLNNSKYGNIMRIKGYFYQDNIWYNINVVKHLKEINQIDDGQDVIIVIGEKLNKEEIEKFIEGVISKC